MSDICQKNIRCARTLRGAAWVTGPGRGLPAGRSGVVLRFDHGYVFQQRGRPLFFKIMRTPARADARSLLK